MHAIFHAKSNVKDFKSHIKPAASKLHQEYSFSKMSFRNDTHCVGDAHFMANLRAAVGQSFTL